MSKLVTITVIRRYQSVYNKGLLVYNQIKITSKYNDSRKI